MSKKEKVEVHWLNKPQDHNYPAAISYLSLLYDEKTAASLVKQLESAPLVEFKAKDIFRASHLSLLGVSNLHVRRDIKKIKSGELLSPLLLIRDQTNRMLIIADGYHRLCAVYRFDEDALIPCKIA
jgi:disulfide oxidoreductase YuzD